VKRFAVSSLVALAGLLASSLAHATVYEIGPADDLPAAISALVPGDELVLGGGTYSIAQLFEVTVSGTSGMPITIRAKDGEVPIITRPDANQNTMNVVGSYLTFRGLEVTGGSRGIRLQAGASHVTIEDCHVHDVAANAISANDTGSDYGFVVLRHNHIHHTGDVGEGMYLGCNDDGCQFHDGVIEGNWVHDTNGPTVTQGDGIEIKEGSYGNVVRDNVIHDTGYPCIITYSTVGNGAPNVIERNFMFNCGDHGIQSAADATIKNNIILSAAADGIRNQTHQSGSPANLIVSHNTVIKAGGDAIRSDGIVGSVVIANNAVYAQGGNAIRVAGDLGAVTVVGNAGVGALSGIASGLDASGDIALNFVGASYSGAPPNDVFPAAGLLVAGGDAAQVVSDDFNGTARGGVADVGAYKFDAANPGWVLGSGFKDAPQPTTGSGGGSGAGGGTGSGGPGATGSGGAGAGGGGDGSEGNDVSSCGCRTTAPLGDARWGFVAVGALAAAMRRRARR
jgi:hypothetical protein